MSEREALCECYKLVCFNHGRRERKVQRICEELLGKEVCDKLKIDAEWERHK